MAATESIMMPLGTKAPSFKLHDVVSNTNKSLTDIKSDKVTVVMFICNHCPYVKNIQKGLVDLTNEYLKKGVSFVAINPNDPEKYPADSPEKMKEDADRLGYPFPYLFDETQEVAKAYGAVCTPEFYAFDGELKCAYRGQFDDSRPHNGMPVTGVDLRKALDAILTGDSVNPDQKPSLGCSIKWKN
ncbi:thioredoxin family protein [candidate division KSB1 bacterium]|nr:thioredoxin family protein [candidate division KSB1 bacterium]